MAHARPTRSLANRLGRTAAETPNLLDPLEPRTLLSDWWIAGSIGGADWVGGLGGGFSGYGLAISGAYGDGDWYVEGSYSSGPVDVVVGASGSGESGQVAGEAQGQLRAPAGVAEIGAQLAVEWTPDGGGAKVDVWRIGPGGWHKEAAVADATGQFVWDTTDDVLGWHAFVTRSAGQAAPQTSGAIRLDAPGSLPAAAPGDHAGQDTGGDANAFEPPVSLTLRSATTVVSPLLQPELDIRWDTAALPDSRAEIDLWAREDGGAWTRLTAQDELTAGAGRFRWDITALTPGRYTLTATLEGHVPPAALTGDVDIEIV